MRTQTWNGRRQWLHSNRMLRQKHIYSLHTQHTFPKKTKIIFSHLEKWELSDSQHVAPDNVWWVSTPNRVCSTRMTKRQSHTIIIILSNSIIISVITASKKQIHCDLTQQIVWNNSLNKTISLDSLRTDGTDVASCHWNEMKSKTILIRSTG